MGTSRTTRQGSAIDFKRVAICGNPNSGKTTIFNAITGLNQRVANYPGVTVEKVTGRFSVDRDNPQRFVLVDVPGTYSLAAFSPDEYIAAATLYGEADEGRMPDAIIYVLDATNIERGLYLLFQVLQTGLPVVVALNMIDLSQRRGIQIDVACLSAAIGGWPVVPVVGNRGNGIDRLKLKTARVSTVAPADSSVIQYDSVTEEVLAQLQSGFSRRERTRAHLFRILFDTRGPAEAKFIEREGPRATEVVARGRAAILQRWLSLTAAETTPLTDKATEVFGKCVATDHSGERMLTEKVDRYLLHRWLGPLVLLVMMALIFQSIFSWAEPFMGLIDGIFNSLADWVTTQMASGPLRSLITAGIIGGVGSVLVFVPQIAILFVFIALLEDSGYMSRAAFLVDRMFRWCGLSGKSFIPMLSSFACAVPGIMATRTIEDRKLRLITIMVAPLMTCSARLPVYAIMIAAFVPYRSYLGVLNLQGIVLLLLYLLGVLVAVIVSYILSRVILKTEQGTFLMELPSYKVPTFKTVMIKVFIRVRTFVIRAGTVIMAITVVIWALSYYPRSRDVEVEYDRQNKAVLEYYDFAAMTAAARLTGLVDTDIRDNDDLTGLLEHLDSTGEFSISQASPAVDQLRDLESCRRAAIAELRRWSAGEQLRRSYIGQLGRVLQPAFGPLGWDWKITMATLAAFPAREVIIATLGTIYNLGTDVDAESASLVDKMRQDRWHHGPRAGQPIFTIAVALSIMVFFAICCQCGATLVTIRHETGGWRYALFAFTYMTILAYLLALATYQLAAWWGW
ncbi:MAG: ferrous iron transport protein B [bacterium]